MKPLTILIVDDSAMMRQFVRRAVQLSEVPVATAGAPPAAPSGLLNGQPIWMDLTVER